ncbi:MAG: hypothetical protein PHG85_03605 [Candidatus Altiarchaeota archaeon]|nr:hypothetical protein [Candidatus Altiarchaeota archaeon]
MDKKYYVVIGAILGGIIGAVIAYYLQIHMGLTTVFCFGLGFLLVERQIRDQI